MIAVPLIELLRTHPNPAIREAKSRDWGLNLRPGKVLHNLSV